MWGEVELGALVVTAVIVTVAGVFRGFAGFGSGLLMAPVLAIALGPALAVPLINLLSIAASAQMVPGALQRCRWRVVLPIGLPTCLFIPLGNHLLQVVDPDLVKTIISLSVLASVAALGWGLTWRGALRPAPMIAAGVLSGVLTGIGGVGGPPLVLLLVAAGSSAEHSRADLTAIFGIETLAIIGAYAYQGTFAPQLLTLAVGSLPLFIAGIALGSWLFARGGEGSYKKVALGFLAGVAALGLSW